MMDHKIWLCTPCLINTSEYFAAASTHFSQRDICLVVCHKLFCSGLLIREDFSSRPSLYPLNNQPVLCLITYRVQYTIMEMCKASQPIGYKSYYHHRYYIIAIYYEMTFLVWTHVWLQCVCKLNGLTNKKIHYIYCGSIKLLSGIIKSRK